MAGTRDSWSWATFFRSERAVFCEMKRVTKMLPLGIGKNFAASLPKKGTATQLFCLAEYF